MRQIRFFLLLPVTLLFIGFGLALAQEDSAAIDDLRQQWEELYNQGDIAGVADLYAEDAVLFSAAGEVVEGREAIQDNIQMNYNEGATNVTIEAIETEVMEDMAHDIGSYSFASAEGQAVAGGNYLVIARQVDGEWQISRHISNTDMSMMQGMTGGGMTGGGGSQ